jgi:glycosyltransferase involved in cell wall biosynthesis
MKAQSLEPLSDARNVRPTRMRILHVINQLDIRAGAEMSLLELVVGSPGSQYCHGIVVLRGLVPDRGMLDKHEVSVFVPDGSGRHRIEGVRHVLAAITAFEPDLIHTSLFDADVAGRIAGRLRSVPVITSLVNTPYLPEALAADPAPQWKLKQVQRLDRFLARRATTAFHAISDATADHAVQHLGVDRGAIRVVPRGRRSGQLGVRSNERRRQVRERNGWDENRPIILNVAREEPQKGHALLLRAFQKVLREHPESLLVLAGRRGRSSVDLNRMIEREGMGDAVQRLGERRDIADLMAAADLFAFTSLYEGLGGAVVEATGLGLPTVAFDIPAVVEVLGSEHPWLVPTGDIGKLGATLSSALASGAERRAQVGASQRRRFEERFEMDQVVEQMLRLYRDVHRITAATPRPPFVSPNIQVRSS